MGLGLLVFFVLLRFTNWYGDPIDWSVQATPLLTFLSFINVDKYPASLLLLVDHAWFCFDFSGCVGKGKEQANGYAYGVWSYSFFITYFTSILFMRWLPVFFLCVDTLWTRYTIPKITFLFCMWSLEKVFFVERGVYGLDWCHCFYIRCVIFTIDIRPAIKSNGGWVIYKSNLIAIINKYNMWKYSIAYTVPLVVYFFASGQRMGLFAALIYLFGLLPLLELLLRGNTHNMNEDAEQKGRCSSRLWLDTILLCTHAIFIVVLFSDANARRKFVMVGETGQNHGIWLIMRSSWHQCSPWIGSPI